MGSEETLVARRLIPVAFRGVNLVTKPGGSRRVSGEPLPCTTVENRPTAAPSRLNPLFASSGCPRRSELLQRSKCFETLKWLRDSKNIKGREVRHAPQRPAARSLPSRSSAIDSANEELPRFGLRLNFYFNTNEWRITGRLVTLDGLYGVHRFRLHPMYRPVTRVSRRVRALDVSDSIPRLVVANVRRFTARIPVQKKARPMMVMHRLRLTGWRHGDFQDPHQRILKNDLVAIGRRRHRVTSVGEIRRISCSPTDLLSANDDQQRRRNSHCYLYAQPTRTICDAHGIKSTTKSTRFPSASLRKRLRKRLHDGLCDMQPNARA